MKKICVVFEVDEDILMNEVNGTGVESLSEAISQELGWVADSGMYVQSWEFADEQSEEKEQLVAKLAEIKSRWDNELAAKYGGELEIDYLLSDESDDLHGFYACAFHDEPKDGCDSWIEIVEELKDYNSVFCLADYQSVVDACRTIGIPVCL